MCYTKNQTGKRITIQITRRLRHEGTVFRWGRTNLPESILDLVQYSSFEKITVADFNEEEGRKVVEWLNDPRVDFVKINVLDHEDTVTK